MTANYATKKQYLIDGKLPKKLVETLYFTEWNLTAVYEAGSRSCFSSAAAAACVGCEGGAAVAPMKSKFYIEYSYAYIPYYNLWNIHYNLSFVKKKYFLPYTSKVYKFISVMCV